MDSTTTVKPFAHPNVTELPGMSPNSLSSLLLATKVSFRALTLMAVHTSGWFEQRGKIFKKPLRYSK